MYHKFYFWLLSGLRARLELDETKRFDGLRYLLVTRLPFPR